MNITSSRPFVVRNPMIASFASNRALMRRMAFECLALAQWLQTKTKQEIFACSLIADNELNEARMKKSGQQSDKRHRGDTNMNNRKHWNAFFPCSIAQIQSQRDSSMSFGVHLFFFSVRLPVSPSPMYSPIYKYSFTNAATETKMKKRRRWAAASSGSPIL